MTHAVTRPRSPMSGAKQGLAYWSVWCEFYTVGRGWGDREGGAGWKGEGGSRPAKLLL